MPGRWTGRAPRRAEDLAGPSTSFAPVGEDSIDALEGFGAPGYRLDEARAANRSPEMSGPCDGSTRGARSVARCLTDSSFKAGSAVNGRQDCVAGPRCHTASAANSAP